jgi:hypothetical protein
LYNVVDGDVPLTHINDAPNTVTDVHTSQKPLQFSANSKSRSESPCDDSGFAALSDDKCNEGRESDTTHDDDSRGDEGWKSDAALDDDNREDEGESDADDDRNDGGWESDTAEGPPLSEDEKFAVQMNSKLTSGLYSMIAHLYLLDLCAGRDVNLTFNLIEVPDPLVDLGARLLQRMHGYDDNVSYDMDAVDALVPVGWGGCANVLACTRALTLYQCRKSNTMEHQTRRAMEHR